MRLVILGAGGYGRTVCDLARQTGKYEEIIFLDDHNRNAAGVCDTYTDYINADTELYPAFGNNEIRMDWIAKLKASGAKICSIIHPSAYTAPSAVIGSGTMVLPNASIGTNARIGEGCIINMNAVVDHDCLLEDGVHICLGAIVKSGIIIKYMTKVEAGQVITKN